MDDLNNASDGDLLVAWALQRAFQLWKDDRYQRSPCKFWPISRASISFPPIEGLVLLPGTKVL